MELHYPGKSGILDILNGPKASFPTHFNTEKNALLEGDNLPIMRTLLDSPLRFDLCYIDPPFATGHSFRSSTHRSATISKSNADAVAYNDFVKGAEFIEFIRQRAIVIRELLSDNGSFYLHIDYKIGHYVKVILDEIFGTENFRNDITRIKCNPKNFRRNAYGNIKDMILFYTKSRNFLWNEPTSPLNDAEIFRLFKKIDAHGRRYTTVPVHAPGETQHGPTAQAWKGLYPPKGRHWRTSPDELDQLDNNGFIEWSSTGNPRRIIYADEHQGKKIQDIWDFKDPAHPGYPTEKNLALLRLIINASSNAGSHVLDCFAGSGTTLLASALSGRRWVGIDQSATAIKAIENKLHTCPALTEKPDFQYLKAQ